MAAPAPISQKEYLKKYLGGKNDKKKKKRKKSSKDLQKGMKIVEDGSDIKDLPFGYDDDDDAPTIAEITYDSEKLKEIDEYNKIKQNWKNIQKENFGNSLTHDIKKLSSPQLGRKRHDSDDSSPTHKRNDIADCSPPRRKRHNSDSSSPRNKGNNSDYSPPTRKRHNSDNSPPRNRGNNSDCSPPRRKRLNSPPRNRGNDPDCSPPRRKRHNSDNSPPRNRGNNSDCSPPRRKRHNSDNSPPRRRKGKSSSTVDELYLSRDKNVLPDDENTKYATKDPLLTKHQSHSERNMTTEEYLKKMRYGKLKKLSPEELARQDREKVLQKEAEKAHLQWNRGVKQLKDNQAKITSDIHEMGKSFARHADDVDMNNELKGHMRREDPMLEYMQEKQMEMQKKMSKTKLTIMPIYKGPFPPNRFNIRPGYRWDGVDRSSGFEKDWFERQNNKMAENDESYKWCSADM